MSSEQDFLAGYDDVEPDAGSSFSVLDKGDYYFEVEKIVRQGLSKNGIPTVAYMLRVLEGKLAKRTLITEFYLGAGRLKSAPNGEGQVERTEEEYGEALRKNQGRWKGFMKELGVPSKVNASVPANDPDFIFQVMNVNGAVGAQFIGEVSIDKDGRNRLGAIRSVNHATKGLAALRAKAANATSTPAARAATL
jgi:hypothetical protein